MNQGESGEKRKKRVRRVGVQKAVINRPLVCRMPPLTLQEPRGTLGTVERVCRGEYVRMTASLKGWIGAVTLAAAAVFTVPASAASWLEQNFYLSGPRYDS